LLGSGRISAAGVSFPCTILDMNGDGAHVRFDQAVQPPSRFRLLAHRGRMEYLAALIWANPPDYGLAFILDDRTQP